MVELKKEDLHNVKGGSISGSLINAFARAINAILDLGRSLGTAIRRINKNKLCGL